MTRKRKNIEPQNDQQSKWMKQEIKEENGDRDEQGQDQRTFPKKNFDRKVKMFEEQDDHYDKSHNWNKHSKSNQEEEKRAFPTELCHYLKSMEAVRNAESLKKLEDIAYEKCASECSGEEIALLTFKETCVLIESLFGSSPYAARLYLTGISRNKHSRILNVLFSGCSAKAIELLLFRMAETQHPENIKNWLDSVGDQNASFILRAISRICCGLPKRKDNERYEDRTCNPRNQKTTPELQEIFSKICQLALDYSTVKNLLDYPVCSLLIQEVVECNRISKGNKHRKFLGQILESMQKEDADGDLIVKQWEGKNSSRIWDALVTELDENDASQIWMSIIQPKFDRLSLHPSANFVLQRFIEGSHSFDLATDILDEIGPRMSKLVDSSRTGVICSLIKCIRNHEQLQETLLKNLRATFKAEKSSNKTKFIYNLLTLNTYNGIFDCKVLKPLGCVLVKELLSLEKRKTIVACLMEMPAEHIRTMSIHGPACRVLQSAIESPTLDEEVKNKIIGAFESYWVDLIANPYSSHLFDRIWDYWGVREKQDLLKKLVPIRNESRQWKFAMLKADMKLFRDDRKAWVAKMKQQKELLKEKANR